MSAAHTQSIKEAIVLAAGFGTRMGEAGKKLPKPLFELGGKPLIDHILENMKGAGIARVLVTLHHRAAELESYLSARTEAWPQIGVSNEHSRLLDTGGGILQALHFLFPEATCNRVCFVHNCDAYWLSLNSHAGTAGDFARLSRSWDRERMDGLLLLEPAEAGPEADFVMEESEEESGMLHSMEHGKGEAFRYVGLQVVSSELFGGALAGSAFPIQPHWQQAIKRGRLHGLKTNSSRGHWLHVGTLEALVRAESLLPGRKRIS